VDEDRLPGLGERGERGGELVVEEGDRALLVPDRHDDGEHGGSLRGRDRDRRRLDGGGGGRGRERRLGGGRRGGWRGRAGRRVVRGRGPGRGRLRRGGGRGRARARGGRGRLRRRGAGRPAMRGRGRRRRVRGGRAVADERDGESRRGRGEEPEEECGQDASPAACRPAGQRLRADDGGGLGGRCEQLRRRLDNGRSSSECGGKRAS